MLKLLQSKMVKIPTVYLVENDDDIMGLPLGIPFIKAPLKDYGKCVQMLEWDILFQSLKTSGLKFNWDRILREKGFKPQFFDFCTSKHGDLNKEGEITKTSLPERTVFKVDSSNFINDASFKVDLEVLQELKLLPHWFDDMEQAITANIHDTMIYNPTLYNKKLGLAIGDFELSTLPKNVIVIDISSSIPRNVSYTILSLSKTLCEKFYADLLITGTISTLYEYEKVSTLDIEKVYDDNGMANEQVYFKKILEEPRKYKSAIVFGDHHYPGDSWWKNADQISEKQGKELCKWEVNEIVSFHTKSNTELAGYARWFDTENITYISNWAEDMRGK